MPWRSSTGKGDAIWTMKHRSDQGSRPGLAMRLFTRATTGRSRTAAGATVRKTILDHIMADVIEVDFHLVW